MKVDAEYLRRHYASLSDESLLELNRHELVQDAQIIYDAEMAARQLKHIARPAARPEPRAPAKAKIEFDHADPGNGETPEWVEGAAEIFSGRDEPGTGPPQSLIDARAALEAGGIPCYMELIVDPEHVSKEEKRWRLLVPGNLAFPATGIMTRDVFNTDFENDWKSHLELMSDEELRLMTPEVAFCGLYDRLERIERAYQEEIARRGLRRRA